MCLAREAQGQVDWRQRLAVSAEARGEAGTGTVAGIDLGAVAAGVEWRAAPTLRLRTTALVLGTRGQTETGRAARA
ncbi:MAG TPA: hypothetical protein VN962_25770, partial [Polyangia bacterium]|nr:hypothetical protein [Polyangia bacterium]